jgi:hypothetical protein
MSVNPQPATRPPVYSTERGLSSLAAALRVDRWHFSPAAKEALTIFGWAIGFRVASATLAFLANVLFPLHDREAFTVLRQTHEFWDSFARFDSGWYNGIAREGYRYVEGGRNNLGFFPMYPLMMHLVGRLFGSRPSHFYYGGIVVSWVAFALAMIVLYRLARLDVPKRAAQRAVLFASAFPFAFFYGVVYSESLFLLLLLTAVYGLRTRRWVLGAVAGALMTATRVNGVMAVPALMWIAWRSAGDDHRQRVHGVAAALFAVAGIASYSTYVYALTGSPFEWYHAISRWEYYPFSDAGSMFASFLRQLAAQPYEYLTQDRHAPYHLLNGAAALAFLAAVPFVWRRFGAGYALLILLNLSLPISSGQFPGLGRYCAVLFPFYLWLATFKSPQVQQSILAGFAMLYLLGFTLFVTIHPFA